MEELTIGEVESIHTMIMERDGGDSRILSEANLNQTVFAANRVSDRVIRAAFLFYSLCAYPAFREGNFLTALGVAEKVLGSGGYRITSGREAVCALADGISAFTTGPEDVENWFRDNTRELLPE